MRWGRVLAAAGGVGFVVGSLTGCHSAYVEAVVSNRTGEALSLVEVDYPSASFGTQTLAPGQDFRYRFKILGSGNLKVLWTDDKRQDHAVAGPELHEGQEGGLGIVVGPGGHVDWNESFRSK